MVGENGTPETPDWHVTPRDNVIVLAPRMRPDEPDIPSNIILGTE